MSYFRPEIESTAGYVPGEQPQDGEFIKLNTNENPYPPSPEVVRAIEETLRRLAKVSRPDGRRVPPPCGRAAGRSARLDPLRQRQRRHSDDRHANVRRPRATAAAAVSELHPLQDAGPSCRAARSEEVRFNADWSLPAEFARGRDDLRVVFLANPNSPSGTMVPPQRVLEIAEQLPCPLLVDEAYVDFADTNCMSLVARCEKIMVSRSLSKSYALAGLRFGYIVAQPQMIEQLIKVKDSYNCDALAIAGATAAIGDQAWLAANRAKILATRRRLVAEMRNLGFVTVDSQSNFTWNTHPRLPVRPIYERLKRDRILVRYMNYPGWGDGLRISVGTDAEIDACLEKLKSDRVKPRPVGRGDDAGNDRDHMARGFT